jgi:hypothetical protein
VTWVLSALTITAMWLAGSKRRLAWKVSLVNQCLWLAWIVAERQWGLLPMNVAMFVIAGRNLYLWRAGAVEGAARDE